MNKCSHHKCGSTKNLFVNHKYKRKDGTLVLRYMCRKCNTKRVNDYYHTKTGKRIYYEMIKRQYKVNKKKVLARTRLNQYYRFHKIAKPTSCQECRKKGRVYAHHHDYDKPFEVVFICSSCHAEKHKK